jgi:hypothetical protein
MSAVAISEFSRFVNLVVLREWRAEGVELPVFISYYIGLCVGVVCVCVCVCVCEGKGLCLDIFNVINIYT